ICEPFRDPGPELDECIESILQQDLESFAAVFINDGSSQDHAARIPLEDPRFSLMRREEPVGWEGCIARFVREHCGADDLVLPLQPNERLAKVESLRQIRTEFESSDCLLLYGQHRLATGEFGDAEPAPDAATHDERGAALAGRSPVFFRARLLLEVPAPAAVHGLSESLVHAAGSSRSRFTYPALTIPAAPAGTKLHARMRADRGPAGSAQAGNADRLPPTLRQLHELPKVSCLMVTHDRLALARRAI